MVDSRRHGNAAVHRNGFLRDSLELRRSYLTDTEIVTNFTDKLSYLRVALRFVPPVTEDHRPNMKQQCVTYNSQQGL